MSALLLRSATAYEELAFHALAHVPPSPTAWGRSLAASLHDPMYLAWVQAASSSPFIEDRVALMALQASGALDAQLLPLLHLELEDFTRSAPRRLAELGPEDVADQAILARLARPESPLVELLRCDMALCSRDFAELYARSIAPSMEAGISATRASLGSLAVRAPALGRFSLVLSGVLGRRGRGFAGRRATLFAGAPMPWNDLGPEDTALLLLHEAAVLLADVGPDGEARHRKAERAAIEAVRGIVAGTPHQGPFEAHLASLDLSGIAMASEVRAETAALVLELSLA